MKFFKEIPGIYLERKKRTKYLNIERMTEVEYIKLVLKDDLEKVINIGEYVKKGQLIARGDISPSVHSPISGEVEGIYENLDIKTGKMKRLIVIKNDFNETLDDFQCVKNADKISVEEFWGILKEKGIVGMGKNPYSTYLKWKRAYEKDVQTLVVNACESEPYVTSDERVTQEKAKEIIEVLDILIKVFNLKSVIIAIEDGKKEAILELKKSIKTVKNVKIIELKRKYPLGEEKILLHTLFRKEYSKEVSPEEMGYLVQNVGTIFAIYEAIILGKPLIDRIITVSGNGIKEAKNLKLKFGTSLRDIINYLEMKEDNKKIIFGGPMSGKAVFNEEALIEKNHNALLFLDNNDINSKKTEVCINCGICVEKCPMGLMPLKYEELYRMREYEELLSYNIDDCIECGICTYVCPSSRPLLESILLGKNKINEVKNVD